jgi:hypothetical protein
MINIVPEKAIASIVEDNSHGSRKVSLSEVDARLQVMTKEYPLFYKNHNLLILYLLMVLGCIVLSVTLGCGNAMMNG